MGTNQGFGYVGVREESSALDVARVSKLVFPDYSLTATSADEVQYSPEPSHLINALLSPYDILNDGTAQSTAGLQAALDDARDSAGLKSGVYLPPGNYKFTSGTVLVHQGLRLQGSWEQMPGHTFFLDGSSQPTPLDGKGTTIQVDTGSGTSTGAFITGYANTAVRGIVFYYPSQTNTAVTPTAYPWTVFMTGETTTGFDQIVENCEFINAYQAIKVKFGGRTILRNLHGQPLFGIELDKLYDSTRIENVSFSPSFSSAIIAAPANNYFKWQNQNGKGFRFGRCDDLNVSKVYMFGYLVGWDGYVSAAESGLPGGGTWGKIESCGAESCVTGMNLARADTNGPGLRLVNFDFTGSHNSSGGSTFGLHTDTGFLGELQVVNSHFGFGSTQTIGVHLQGGGVIVVANNVFYHSIQNFILASNADSGRTQQLLVTGNSFGTGATAGVGVDLYVKGLASGNNFTAHASTGAFTNTTAAGYHFFEVGNRFSDDITKIGIADAVKGAYMGSNAILNLVDTIAVSAAVSPTAQSAAYLQGIASGTNGFGTFAVNALFDGTNWNRLNTANEAWLFQGNSSAGTTGSFAVFHVNPAANPITWVPFLLLDGAGTYLDIKGDLRVNGTKVVGQRETGWTAGTGTANKGAFATYAGQTVTATYVQAEAQATDNAAKANAQRIKAIEDALRTQGLIN